MKKAITLWLVCLLAITVRAQRNTYNSQRELRGSGKLVLEDRAVKPFQAIDIHQFLAKVMVEVGGTQSAVGIRIDDNLKSFLQVESVDGVLTLAFKDPENKAFWLSKGTIQVSVKTPSLNRLRNDSNGDVEVNNLTGEIFSLNNQGNGSVALRGVVKQLNIVSEGNGDIRAKELIAQNANIITQANATIEVNARQLSSQNAAHATIRNMAQGTGQNKGQKSTTEEFVTVILQNNRSTSRTITLRFTEPGNPVYGVINTTLSPYGKRRETYPIGTKIEQLNLDQQKVAMTGNAVQGKLIVTLKANDNGRAYNLLD
ncbi:GIN domain-containing protein [Spirosoma validum]|uniref:DUF2807 domain-containing protein n=1 Tax=Spirosoma validum TaxID=2771355 RepID=A0A927AXN0_9BACT|nr:DUF2807 domain-containing protein [Spirosoma validum]MBD2751587.1 DUF2807 domain-containing protein [Spirosoma validum]